MAESFNAQFLSVFTAEDTSNIPVPEMVFTGIDEDKLVDLEISIEAVRTRLARLREDTSPWARFTEDLRIILRQFSHLRSS